MAACQIWKVILLTTVSCARIGMGLFVGVRGPTLLYLASNVDSSVGTVSYIFLGRSVGVVLGAVSSGFMKRKMPPGFRHMYPLSIVVVLFGICSLTIPPIRVLWLLILNITAGNIMYGYLDAGLQALLLHLFGEKGSRPYIQMFHFTFSVGAFLGPIIAKPFLLLDNKRENATDKCPRETVLQNFTKQATTAATDYPQVDAVPEHADTVQWVFHVIGLWIVMVGCIMLVLAKFNIEANVPASAADGDECEKRKEEPLRDIIWILIIVIVFYMTNVTTESVFYYYLYAVSICSDLKLSISQASYINSVMWLGLGVGRLAATVAANFVEPRTILLFGLAGSIFDALFMCIFGETTGWITWVVAFSHLFTTGIFYPSGVSWTSKVTNVSGTYQFIFAIGSAIGGATMLPLAGYLFELNPFSVMYEVFVLAVLNSLVFGLALYMARRHKVFLREKRHLEQKRMLNVNGEVEEKL